MIRRCLLAALLTAFCGCAQTRKEVDPNVQHEHRVDKQKPWSIHVIRIPHDKNYRPHVVLGRDRVLGLETLSSIVKRLPADAGRPIAAVNGDFYALPSGPTQGDPTSLCIVDGELVSGPRWRALWFDRDGTLQLADVKSKMTVKIGDRDPLPLLINRGRDKKHAVLFTPRFGPNTNMEGGLELILEPARKTNWLPLKVQATIPARVAGRSVAGDTRIPADGMVLSLAAEPATKLGAVKKGEAVEIKTMLSHDLSGVKTALGGGPILMRDGKLAVKQKKKDPRHPRTAIGCNQTHIILVVVDGRQAKLSVGMSFFELATLMRKLGCTEAINLDGGGSSTMWHNGKVVNSPSGWRERPLGNALLFLK